MDHIAKNDVIFQIQDRLDKLEQNYETLIEQVQLERLMPWSKDLPAECYSKRRKCAALYLVWGEGFALYIFIRRYNK